MHFDELMEALGEFGPYQRVRFFLICLFSIASAWHALNMVFIGASPDFHCDLDPVNVSGTLLADLSPGEREALLIPTDSQCHQYDVSETLLALETSGSWAIRQENKSYSPSPIVVESFPRNISGTKVACTNGYKYSRDVYSETITSEVSHTFCIYFILLCMLHLFLM